MAKKANRTAPVQNVNPGADPYAKPQSYGKKLGNMLGCACLLVFILFDELWLGTLACGIGFGIIFGIQVFHDKACKWYASPYLYTTLAVLALAYVEYAYRVISNLLNL